MSYSSPVGKEAKFLQAKSAIGFLQGTLLREKTEGPDTIETVKDLSDRLIKGEYLDVIKILFNTSLEKRVKWLRSHSSPHPLLLLVQATEEFRLNPTVKTLHETSVPLLAVAKMRVDQDAICSTKPQSELRDIFSVLFGVTVKNIEVQSYGPLQISGSSIKEGTKKIIREKIRELTAPIFIQNDSLPSPTWLSHEIENGEKELQYLDSPYWNNKRRHFVEKYLQELPLLNISAAF